MLRNGTAAPEFTLISAQNEPVSLAQIRGDKPTLLFFFREGGCPTTQRDLIKYANVAGRIKAMGGTIAAISTEPPAAHAALAEKFGLSFELLSDPALNVGDQYGVYHSDDDPNHLYGEPAVFIIDTDGNIAYSQVQTGPKGSADPGEMALILLYMTQNGGRY